MLSTTSHIELTFFLLILERDVFGGTFEKEVVGPLFILLQSIRLSMEDALGLQLALVEAP